MVGITDIEKAEISASAKFITAQSRDANCQAACISAGTPITCVNINSYEVLARVLPLDGASQRGISASLRPRVLHHCHYFFLAGHHGERGMYDSIRMDLYWPDTASYIYKTVRDC